MLSFEENDAAVFFGRLNELREFSSHLSRNVDDKFGRHSYNIILGASGRGKSSFLNAGILPRLRKQPERWIIIKPFRPYRLYTTIRSYKMLRPGL